MKGVRDAKGGRAHIHNSLFTTHLSSKRRHPPLFKEGGSLVEVVRINAKAVIL
jgi:hypothetical protein